MVVDGKGSEECALVGDNLAELGFKNGWSGIIVNGCIRDRHTSYHLLLLLSLCDHGNESLHQTI